VAASAQGRHAGKAVEVLPSFDESINDLYESFASDMSRSSMSHGLSDDGSFRLLDTARSPGRNVRKHQSKPDASLESLEEQVPNSELQVS
jgi:hypothetical protein